MAKKSRKESRRQESLNKYIDELMQANSRLDAVRIDLYYKVESRDEITFDSFDQHIKRLYNNQRSNAIFKYVKGYAIKMEEGRGNNLHAHALFLMDGRQCQEWAIPNIGNAIGRYWDKVITGGKGCYHNCNMRQYENNGLGRIEYNDTAKMQALKENVLPYFCKESQSIRTTGGKRIKTLRRGGMPKQTNRGRRRKYKAEEYQDK